MTQAYKILEEVLKQTQGGKRSSPVEEHKIVYDSSSETLEPIYFWILDFMNNLFGGNVEKITDNFSASAGGGYHSEMSQKKGIMQDQVSKNLTAIGQVMKNVINIIYDLKDFETRLHHYDMAKSEKKPDKQAGILALKQIWLDNVDIKRGVGSIHQLTTQQQLNFATLRDAFMAASSVKEVDKLDLNDRVKRILKPRISEFFHWIQLSEDELRKRFDIEKNYLKSQVNSLKLYSKWVKPYLKSAAELEMGDSSRNPDLVKSFSTSVFELTLMGKDEINVESEMYEGNLPPGIKVPKRKYYSIVFVDFYFRGIPGKLGQNYVFGGKAQVNFRAYAINEQELQAFNQQLEKSDINEVLRLIQGATDDSLDAINEDIAYFLKSDEERKEKKESKNTDPFSALFSGMFTGWFKKKPVKTVDGEIEIKRIKKDSYSETLVRELAADSAAETCFTVFDVYKKSHGMASHESPYG